MRRVRSLPPFVRGPAAGHSEIQPTAVRHSHPFSLQGSHRVLSTFAFPLRARGIGHSHAHLCALLPRLSLVSARASPPLPRHTPSPTSRQPSPIGSTY